jgi:Asp-tRNA(Asn)/Glu-tRNA(Gln) amidotransferase A subunit family amidase
MLAAWQLVGKLFNDGGLLKAAAGFEAVRDQHI